MKKFSWLIVLIILATNIFLISCNNKTPVSNYSQNSISTNDQGDIIDKNDENKSDEEKIKKTKVELKSIKKLEDRIVLEQKRKTLLGEFYVPLIPSNENKEKLSIKAKGLYVSGSTAANKVSKENVTLYENYIKASIDNAKEKIHQFEIKIKNVNKLEKIIAIANVTEINSLVIDVKNDDGLMTYNSDIGIVKNLNGNRYTTIKDIESLLKLLKEYNIYPIARIVTFKDRNFSKKMPERSIQLKNGGVWEDFNGVSWVNPFDKYVWEYNVSIAKEASLMGFNEIQFDYVRFPANAYKYNKITKFPNRNDRDKDEAIEGFLHYAKKELKDYHVNISADVFGVITKSWDDTPEDIGQTWRKIARNVDIISPMIYPSHYGPGWYGYNVPDANPYGVLRGALLESLERNSSLENPPSIRPWIQDFTATWVDGYIKYTDKEVRAQIIAGKELSIDEYLVWNPSNNYNPLSFVLTDDENKKIEQNKNNTTDDKDILGRTPKDTIERYLLSEKNNINSKLYLLTPINYRSISYDAFKENIEEINNKLINYEVLDYTLIDNSNAEVTLSYKYLIDINNKQVEVINENDKWKLIKEEGVWKVLKSEINKINNDNQSN